MELRPDHSEYIRYDYEGFPAYSRRGRLSLFPGLRAESHWHEDLEFIVVLSGEMYYQVNGQTVPVPAGSGIFVNARQLHFGYSQTGEDCDYLCVLLHPRLLTAVGDSLLLMVLRGEPYVLLSREILWQNAVLEAVADIYDHREEKTAPLRIQEAFCRIWRLLLENLPGGEAPVPDHRLGLVKEMVSFLQENIQEPITLSRIAQEGNVSKSTCLQLFKRYLGDTPANFLLNCRLNKAADLLAQTDRPVLDIALGVGFSSGSYFAERFRKAYGCTPRQYRTRMGKG